MEYNLHESGRQLKIEFNSTSALAGALFVMAIIVRGNIIAELKKMAGTILVSFY